MKYPKTLTEQVRAVRLYGAFVTLRSGKLKIKNPLGSVFVESIPASDCLAQNQVLQFISRALRQYAYKALSGGSHEIDPWTNEATWTVENLKFRATAHFAYGFHVNLTLTVPTGEEMIREFTAWNWPDPKKLAAISNGLTADYALVSKLRVYLENHEKKFNYACGARLPGGVDITFLHGRMVVSCLDEKDFDILRTALDALKDFRSWSSKKSLEARPSPEALDSDGIDLI